MHICLTSRYVNIRIREFIMKYTLTILVVGIIVLIYRKASDFICVRACATYIYLKSLYYHEFLGIDLNNKYIKIKEVSIYMKKIISCESQVYVAKGFFNPYLEKLELIPTNKMIMDIMELLVWGDYANYNRAIDLTEDIRKDFIISLFSCESILKNKGISQKFRSLKLFCTYCWMRIRNY